MRIVFVKAGGRAVYRPTGLMILSLPLHQGMPCGVNLHLCDVKYRCVSLEHALAGRQFFTCFLAGKVK